MLLGCLIFSCISGTLHVMQDAYTLPNYNAVITSLQQKFTVF